jgi:hypothetical protein
MSFDGKLIRLTSDPHVTTTFRIRTSLKKQVEDVAEKRSMTVTAFVVEALEMAVTGEPPLWVANLMAGRPYRRESLPLPTPSLKQQVKSLVFANACGIRTHEIAKILGVPTPIAFNALAALAKEKDIDCHGKRNHRLWTPPGVRPDLRSESISSAIVKVLAESRDPVAQIILQEEVVKLVRAAGKKVETKSVVVGMYKAVRKGVINKVGISGDGVLYALAKQEGGAALGLTVN